MMNGSTKSEAQERADAIRVFRDELSRLEDEGVFSLSDEQKRALASYHTKLLSSYAKAYDIDTNVEAKQLSLGMRIASFLGALALSASIFFLFYQIWGRLDTPVQLLVLVGSALASFVGTMVIHQRDSSGYFTNLAAMVTFVCFVIDLSMLGQIFNLTPTDGAFVAWGVLAMILAYRCDLRLLLVAGIVCLFAFATARVGTWTGIYWMNAGEYPENFLIPGILVFAASSVISHDRHPSFPSIYRVFGAVGVLVPVLILSTWGGGSRLGWKAGTVEGFYQIAGFILSAVLVWLGVRRGWKDAVNTGLTSFVVFLYARLFGWWWDSMPKSLFFFVLALIALLILVVLRRVRRAGFLAGDSGT
jgi:uncharacterized membrane protein